MRKKMNKILFAILLVGLGWSFTACSSDDDDKVTGKAFDYKVELIYEGDISKFGKVAVIGGGAFNSMETDLIDDETGQKLPTSSLSDDNYIFKQTNKFSLSKKVPYLYILVGAMPKKASADTKLKVTVKVYRDGKLIDTIQDEAVGNKNAEINSTYYTD